MKITNRVIILIVAASFTLFPLVNLYWDVAWRVMLYFTFITNVAMWIITLRVYVFQQQLKDSMDTPLLKKLFGRKKHD